jgi:hypothetical protein
MHDFFPRFFLSSSNMATGCDRRSLYPFGVPLGVCMRNRKLCNTRSRRRLRDPSEVSLGCSLRRPRPITIGNPGLIFSMVTGTKHPRPIFSMVTGTNPGYLPLLFSYSV